MAGKIAGTSELAQESPRRRIYNLKDGVPGERRKYNENRAA